jgi:hypothetical protein
MIPAQPASNSATQTPSPTAATSVAVPPMRLDVSESVWPTSTILHEIEWCANRIATLEPMLSRKPSKKWEIADLRRQIKDKRAVIDYRRTR